MDKIFIFFEIIINNPSYMFGLFLILLINGWPFKNFLNFSHITETNNDYNNSNTTKEKPKYPSPLINLYKNKDFIKHLNYLLIGFILIMFLMLLTVLF